MIQIGKLQQCWIILELKKGVFKLNELINFSEYVLIQLLEPEAQAQV